MSEQELDFSGLRDETVRELANLAARVAEGGVQELDFSGLGDDTLRVLANLGGIDEDVVGEDLTRDLRDVDPDAIQSVIQQAQDFWLTARPMDDPGLVSNEVPGAGPGVIAPFSSSGTGWQQMSVAEFRQPWLRPWKNNVTATKVTICATSGSTIDEVVFVNEDETTTPPQKLRSEECCTSGARCVEVRCV